MDTPFDGFVAGGVAVTLPAQFFVEVLPGIDNEAELRVTLYALYAIARRRGELRAVRGGELAREAPLARTLATCGGIEALAGALAAAVARGTLLACPLDDGDTLYLVHNEAGRRALARIQAGALVVPGAAPLRPQATVEGPGRPAQVYEQEIGALTPAVAEALVAAVERWPEPWIVEALRLAATRNARSWRYAEAILERWETEGRDDGTTGGAAARAAGRDHGSLEQVIRRT
jgi:DnaD/phage-associated family protein